MAAGLGPRVAWTTFALALAALVLFACWAAFWRTPALDEVLARNEWTAGDVEIAGTIANVTRTQTSHGPAVLLEMEPTLWGWLAGSPATSNAFCLQLRADPAGQYAIGQAYRTTLHFREVTVNGARAVTAPELACPFPALGNAIAVVLDAVGNMQGGSLQHRGADTNGSTVFEVVTSHGQRLPAAGMPAWLGREVGTGTPLVSLSAWTQESAATYVLVTKLSAAGHGELAGAEGGLQAPVVGLAGTPAGNASFATVEAWDSLGNASAPSRLRFHDVDGDGMVGDGDRVHVRLDAPPATFQRYALRLGDCTQACVAGAALFVAGPDGVETWAPRGSSRGFQSILDGPVGTVAEIRIGRPFGPAPPLAEVRLDVFVDEAAVPVVRTALRHGPLSEGQPRVTFTDANGNGLADQGDWITVDAVGKVEVRLYDVSRNMQLTALDWVSAPP